MSFLQLASLFGNIALAVIIITFTLSIAFSLIDNLKRRKVSYLPFISFAISSYNDGSSVENTINSIYKAYDKDKLEILIVNDASTDNTLSILKKLQKKYKFILINNKENLGKSTSLNNAFKKTKGEIVLFVDSDTKPTRECIIDMLARFEEDPNVGGVSCRYKVSKSANFWAQIQKIEYNMMALMQSSYNIFSTLGMWGGFIAFRRKAFQDIGGFSVNYLTEDVESAIKLKEAGWTAKMSYVAIETEMPEHFRTWYKQKLRWAQGFMQVFINHISFYLKNPLAVFLQLSYVFFAFNFIFGLFGYFNAARMLYLSPLQLDFLWSFLYIQLKNIAIYLAFTIPYVVYDKEDRKQFSKYLLLIPFAIIYFPVFSAVSVIGFVKAIKNNHKYKEGVRAW